ncbi:recombinase family protein [Herbiconiux sp. KACC 21604]|uniref:recombinase family protein n=1 Tax=unclassified Herbiconiux TaxID=2618217 RepID=UPI001492F852|nr:recombinase family protein [Herbiconiux sp. SALV-R1]QJU54527.1 recombinase family protein [Herbiconiux sp. SALV-R1]WPO85610.1 recombinase family protein [Herbiconiux sp. KACC 21604]
MSTAHSFAYLRVSSASQSFDRQRPAFDGLDIPESHFITDKISGTKDSRPGLDKLIGTLNDKGEREGGLAREGDTIWVHSVDRLGRSTTQILETVKALRERGIQLRAIKSDGINFDGVNGELILTMLAALATWERANIAERVAEARAARKTQGKSTGRKKSLDAKGVADVLKLKAQGKTPDQIATKKGVSRATVYRVLSENK